MKQRENELYVKYRKTYFKIDSAKKAYRQWIEDKKKKAAGGGGKVKNMSKENIKLNAEHAYTELLRQPSLVTLRKVESINLDDKLSV